MKDKITSRQFMLLLFSFLCANTLMKGYSPHGKTAGFLSILAAVPIGLFYAFVIFRLGRLYPQKDFFEITEAVFCRWIKHIFAFILTAFCILDIASICAYLISFVRSLSVSRGLWVPFIILLFCTLIFFALSQGRTVGAFMQIGVPLLSLLFLLCIIFSLAYADFQKVTPFFENGADGFLRSFAYFSLLPFSTTVFLFPYTKESEPLRKRNYFIPTILAGLLLAAFYLLNPLLLGKQTIEILNFPSYMALSVLDIDGFFQRIEIFLFGAFILCDAIRLGAGVRFCADGIKNLIKAPRVYITVPVTLLVITLGVTCFSDPDEILNISNFDLAVPFLALFLIPITVWVGAEAKNYAIAKGRKL